MDLFIYLFIDSFIHLFIHMCMHLHMHMIYNFIGMRIGHKGNTEHAQTALIFFGVEHVFAVSSVNDQF